MLVCHIYGCDFKSSIMYFKSLIMYFSCDYIAKQSLLRGKVMTSNSTLYVAPILKNINYIFIKIKKIQKTLLYMFMNGIIEFQ